MKTKRVLQKRTKTDIKKEEYLETTEFNRNLPPSVQQYRTESTQCSFKFKKGSSSPLGFMLG